ncbi:MAG: glycosyltransferase family 4 protein [Ignavibacteria bacterium]|nr:glycosyltransferase family 4 protein [Ignavibacteria bacterium]
MKILVVNWQDIRHPQGGGAEVHLQEVFSRIARMGHEVTLSCCRFPGAPREEVIGGIRILREGGRHFFNFRFLLSYLTRFRRESFDVVVDDMNKIPFFSPLFVRKPILGITHHLFGKSIFLEANPLIAAYVYLMEALAVRLYRRTRVPFVVGSPSTYREMMHEGFPKSQIHLVPYGVDHDTHRMTGVPKSPFPLIGYIGRLKRYKSVDQLLRALPAVRANVPELKVQIVGEGGDRVRLESLSARLGLERCVGFTGFVTEERKLELLQQMWCKVTTSTKEGWGLTVIEANACGIPVVASNVPGLRDAVKDNETGLLYPYGDTHALAEQLTKLLTDEALRHRLARNAVAWAETFDWNIAAEKTLALLEERAGKTIGAAG